MPGKIDWYGLTDPGKVRPSNEDQFLIADLNKSMLIHQTSVDHESHTRLFGPSQGHLLAVADGMGGHAAGKRASSIAIDTMTRYVLGTMSWFLNLQGHHEDDLKEDLEAAMRRCQQTIEQAAEANPAVAGMGTTLTLAYISWPRLYVVHVGDSRCYLYRGAHLEQITRDHTVAQQAVDAGALTPQQAGESRLSHVLWNCLGGGSEELHPEVYKTQLTLGDTLLLCTDGLSGALPDRLIREVLGQNLSAQQTCVQLVRAANEAGGKDNITAVVARFRDADEGRKVQHQAAHAPREETHEPDTVVLTAG